MVCQADRVAERVDFPFALVKLFFHGCPVLFPRAAVGTFVEAVGIRVDVNAPGLTVDNTCQHGFYRRIFVGELNMRENLCRRVAQPHGVDVTCKDERVGLAVYHLMFASRIECIGKAVFEHPSQFRIFQLCFGSLDSPFDSSGCKLPLFRCRTLASVL